MDLLDVRKMLGSNFHNELAGKLVFIADYIRRETLESPLAILFENTNSHKATSILSESELVKINNSLRAVVDLVDRSDVDDLAHSMVSLSPLSTDLASPSPISDPRILKVDTNLDTPTSDHKLLRVVQASPNSVDDDMILSLEVLTYA
jgi:hypothetical protein